MAGGKFGPRKNYLKPVPSSSQMWISVMSCLFPSLLIRILRSSSSTFVRCWRLSCRFRTVASSVETRTRRPCTSCWRPVSSIDPLEVLPRSVAAMEPLAAVLISFVSPAPGTRTGFKGVKIVPAVASVAGAAFGLNPPPAFGEVVGGGGLFLMVASSWTALPLGNGSVVSFPVDVLCSSFTGWLGSGEALFKGCGTKDGLTLVGPVASAGFGFDGAAGFSGIVSVIPGGALFSWFRFSSSIQGGFTGGVRALVTGCGCCGSTATTPFSCSPFGRVESPLVGPSFRDSCYKKSKIETVLANRTRRCSPLYEISMMEASG